MRAWAAALLLGCLLLAGFSVPSEASEETLRRPILHNGRVKPFDSFARETVRFVTGAPRWKSEDPAETVRSILDQPEQWQPVPLISVPFIPLREKLGLFPSTGHVSHQQLIESRRLMRMLPAIVQKQSREEKISMLEQETLDVYERFVALDNLFNNRLHWIPAEDSPALWRLKLEVAYNRMAPFAAARWIYGAAFLGFLSGLFLSWRSGWVMGKGLLAVGFLVHAGGILTRVVLAGRPPVSNFYETMLWLPLVAVGLGFIFERIYKTSFFGLAASVLAALILLLADTLPLEPGIVPIVAVLRSNLWLTIHVLTIVASYGALTLATVLAHLYGGLYLSRKDWQSELSQLGLFLYRSIQVGVVLLASGIMLGGVWANASWGRYWGWDPKETWALITLLWFLAVLHGRFAGWLKEVGLAVATMGGFFLLLMTYYGVSFYLVGLHSYAGGHAKPLPPLLIGCLAAEILFMGLVAVKACYTKTDV